MEDMVKQIEELKKVVSKLEDKVKELENKTVKKESFKEFFKTNFYGHNPTLSSVLYLASKRKRIDYDDID